MHISVQETLSYKPAVVAWFIRASLFSFSRSVHSTYKQMGAQQMKDFSRVFICLLNFKFLFTSGLF